MSIRRIARRCRAVTGERSSRFRMMINVSHDTLRDELTKRRQNKSVESFLKTIWKSCRAKVVLVHVGHASHCRYRVVNLNNRRRKEPMKDKDRKPVDRGDQVISIKEPREARITLNRSCDADVLGSRHVC